MKSIIAKSFVFLFLGTALLLVGCKSNQQKAKDELSSRGFSYSPEAFVSCSRDNDFKCVNLFLDAGMNVNAKIFNPGGVSTSAIFVAAAGNRLEMIKLLASKGADLDLPHKDGLTPLAAAIAGKHEDAVKLLLDLGATTGTMSEGVLVLAATRTPASFGRIKAIYDKKK